MREADEFYAQVIPATQSADARAVARQAFAGLLWSKQFYHYIVKEWLEGDPALPPPPPERLTGRNADWTHIYNADVLAMPDTWEYPWYAAWDLAFHAVALAVVDADFAKDQLVLLLREWYMRPNGQLPAYEWSFDNVNPPVHAWAALRVYKIEQKRTGAGDRVFLERVFHKLLLNFTWWVNREDAEGRNVFEGGFLGLDNIGVFDRNKPLPTGGHLEQSDATGWMAMYSLNMLAIAMELARQNPAYEDVASKFWEHFLYIAHAMAGGPAEGKDDGHDLWDNEDGFFYDVIAFPDGRHVPLKLRSMVGLLPLLAVETLDPSVMKKLPGFSRRLEWFVEHRPDMTANVACMQTPGTSGRRLLAVADRTRLERVLKIMLDEREFLSPYGIRSLSRVHADHPYVLAGGRRRTSRRVRAGRVEDGDLRRQLELARADLVSGQLPHHRSAAALPSLLRQRLQGGVPDRLRPHAHAVGSGGGDLAASHPDLPQGRRRCAAVSTARSRATSTTPRGAITSSSTSASTATPARASAPAIRRAGRRSSPSCCSKPRRYSSS